MHRKPCAKKFEYFKMSLRSNKSEKVVYRIQDEDGNGPFRGWSGSKDWKNCKRGQKYCILKQTPSWECKSTPLGAFTDTWTFYHKVAPYKFGFESIEQLKSYFWRSEIREMAKNGFHAYCLELNRKPIKGSSQLIFLKDAIKKQTKINIFRT